MNKTRNLVTFQVNAYDYREMKIDRYTFCIPENYNSESFPYFMYKSKVLVGILHLK